ncbi:caspase family protein [Myxococcaceae bacterium GXIMD 01537]
MRALALAGLLLAGTAAADSPVAVRRLALLVGVNDGGKERARLRYASTDALAFSRVLTELGGVAAPDSTLLLDVGRAEMLAALARMRTQAEGARVTGAHRVEVLLYYSGHSDEEGLLLKGERLDYGELRRAMQALPADVRIAVLDSCASGAFARRKGGTPRPAFLVDSGSQVKGHAILTSSSADEASQESDRLGGSFFTHHLVSGLRGAADATRDGKVTLTEAYQFAFHETLARTERTQGGAQHPAYDIELAGTGDLVMTDLRSTSAGLVLSEALEGRLFIRDDAGTLAVELQKAAGRATDLGLAPGRYRVRRELSGSVSEATFTLADGKRTQLGLGDFAGITGEATVSRGGPLPAEGAAASTPRVPLLFNASFLPSVSTNAMLAGVRPVENRIALGVVNGGTALVGGGALALVMNQYEAEAWGGQVAGLANIAGDVGGAQVAGALNVARGSLNGIQTAGLINYAGGEVKGFGQFAAGINAARGGLHGMQGAMLVNWAGGASEGLQAALGVNAAGNDFLGLQVAMGVNHTRGHVLGMQGALGLNRANSLTGLQVGLLNVGGDVTGAQLGLINVARTVTGLQLGLINASDEVDGLPLGLLTFEKKGQLHLETWASDIQLANLAVKFGGKYIYTTLMAGIGPDDRLQRFTLGLALGGHIPIGERFWLDMDGGIHTVHSVRDPFVRANLLTQGRLMLGFQVTPRFAVFAGPTYNVFFNLTGMDKRPLTTLPVRQDPFEDGGFVQYWPGAQLGVRI